MNRFVWFLIAGLCLWGGNAAAQTGYIRIPTCGTASPPAGSSQGYMDADGNICTGVSGGGSNAAAGPTGSAVPADGGYTAYQNSAGNLTGVSPTTPLPVSPGTATPAVGASASITSLVLKSSPTTTGVQYFHAENATSTGGYCILYNGTTAPSTGALTAANVLAFQILPASGYCDWTATALAITASAGAVVLVSSAATPYTYTTGTVTASIYGLAQ